MNRMKLYKAVEYLKSVDFYHDTFDLEDEGVEWILKEYGIYEQLSEQEQQELKKDLYELGEKNEFREAIVLASKIDEMAEAGF